MDKPKDFSVCPFVVPGTGFEPAHPCERCHLKAVRLPISPPGQFPFQVYQALVFKNDCKYNLKNIEI